MKHLTEAGLNIMRARELINDPDKWCQHTSCVTIDGDAVMWCMSGAVHEVIIIEDPVEDRHPMEEFSAMDKLARDEGYTDLVVFNDAPITTHQNVMDFMLKAAFAAE